MKKIFVCFFLLLTFPSFALPTEDDLKEFRQEIDLCDKMIDKANTCSQDSSIFKTQIIDCYLNAADKATALYYPDYKYIRYDIMEYIKYIASKEGKNKESLNFIIEQLYHIMPCLPKQLQNFKKIEQGLTQKNPAFLNHIFATPLKYFPDLDGEIVLTDKSIIHYAPEGIITFNCQILENQLLYIKYVCKSHHYKSDNGEDEIYNDMSIHTFIPFWGSKYYNFCPLQTPEFILFVYENAKSTNGHEYGAHYAIWVPSD